MKPILQKREYAKASKGFTLMEVMVSVSIFTLVVTVGIGSLLSINEAYRKSQTDRKVIDSLTYTLESMSRRIRTAQRWDTPPGAPSNTFSFIDQDGIAVTYGYALDPDHVGMDIINPAGSSPSLADGSYDITPEGVHVAPVYNGRTIPGGGLWFTPYTSPNGQKYLQINIGGAVDNGRQSSEFMFQTSVSKRSFD